MKNWTVCDLREGLTVWQFFFRFFFFAGFAEAYVAMNQL